MAHEPEEQRVFDPDMASDLRRRRRRDLAQRIVIASRFLPAEERALIHAVYAEGQPVKQVAELRGEEPRRLRRRVARLVRRILSDEYLFVTHRLDEWTSSRRRVAEACFIRGLSLRSAAEDLSLSLHVVRRHVAAVRAQVEVLTS